jgi:hypothetical protein
VRYLKDKSSWDINFDLTVEEIDVETISLNSNAIGAGIKNIADNISSIKRMISN